ncbi:ABC transporter permease [Yinghuangia seranimata]|uniref:ABC transporter permease n=1 Tax=Yinghuangia seranimata TaxID=408067 RepID=UPI00248BFE90|nr:ABC transporter permease [Yinghuangia seranimata]MDI2129514.1 ABC transporter permease [Yinghuangia seranimata]
MSALFAIARKDLRQRLRDKSAFVLFLLAPIVVAGLMGLAFSNINLHAKVGVVDLDGGPAAAGLSQVLGSPELSDTVTLRGYPTAEAARSAVDAGDIDAAVVVPAGFTAALAGGGTPPSPTVLDDVDHALAAQLVRGVTESYVAQINADRLSVQTALAAGVPAASTTELAARAAQLHAPERIEARGLTDDPLKTVSYFAPGMGIFFVFFMVGFGARSYFTEQQQGTLDRISAAPIGSGTVLLGKSLSTFVYSLVSLGTVTTVSWLVFGARWADPFGVAVLCAAMAVAVVCLTTLVTVLARTERQAEGIASIIVFALALLGGNFVYASASPPALRRLALFTPNGWALRGFTDLGTGIGGWSAVAAPLAGIAVFSAATAVLTLVLLRLRRPA